MQHRVELTPDELHAVLDFLEVDPEPPSHRYLARLQHAYKIHVPWETAARVVRAAEVETLEDRPRRPPEFWSLAIEQATGGTCFESNYAFWSVLTALGFDVALHVNDMPQDHQIACHSALSVTIDGARYLADVGMGMELAAPIALPPSGVAIAGTLDFRNRVRRVASNRWRLELDGSPERLRLGSGLVYEFVDRPWTIEDYDAHVTRDYAPGGLFLNAVRVTRTHPDSSIVRFSPPDTIVRFRDGRWSEQQLTPTEVNGASVAELVGLPPHVVERAFEVLGGPMLPAAS